MTKVITVSPELEALLKKANNPITWAILDKCIDTETDGKYIDYLGLSTQTEGYISYLTKDRVESLAKEDYWLDKKRYHKKIAAIAEVLYPGKYTQREIEVLGTVWRNLFNQKNVDTTQLKLEEGDKIAWCYLEKNYARASGGASLNYSCMRYSGCQDYFDLYTKNVNHVSLAVLYDADEKVRARCLVWYPNGKADKSVVYYDRIYSISNEVTAEMQAMLDSLGFINVCPKNEIKPDHISNIEFEVEFGEESIDQWPYMDTFMYILDKRIGNFFKVGCAELQNQDGGNDRYSCTCDHCEEDVEETFSIGAGRSRGQNLCADCCVYSDHHHCYIATAESICTDWEQEDVLASMTCEDYAGQIMLTSNSVLLYDGNRAYEEDSNLHTSEDGLYFIEGDDNFVEIDRYGYYKVDSADIEEIEGEYYVIGSNQYEAAIERLAVEC